MAEITLRGSTLYFTGDINDLSFEKFRKMIAENRDTIETIQVNSPGGDTISGKLMGHLIYDNEYDIIVDKLCFSSCANYMFTAAKNKLIKADSIVGWHGSDQQDEYLAALEGKTLDEVLREEYDSIPPLTEAEAATGLDDYSFEDFKAENQEETNKEREFLKKIGVNVEVMVYGLLPANAAEYSSGFYGGWTFSVEDMAKFGIQNVTAEGGEYPTAKAKNDFPDILVFKVSN